MKRIKEAEFESIFLESTPLIDLRSPVEFTAGRIPGSVNLPLLSDEERHRIGITYRHEGKAAAIALGHQLVKDEIRSARIDRWIAEVEMHPLALAFCFRGGLRSQTVQSWLEERGYSLPIVEGGFKSLRRFLMRRLNELAKTLEFRVVGGLTGSGKTKYLRTSGSPFIDLEALAKHRGSAFGATTEAQPHPVDFENSIAIELIKLSQKSSPILIEDESRMIGSLTLPLPLFEKIKSSPRLILNPNIDERVDHIFEDYILNSKIGLQQDPSGFDDFTKAVHSISKRLGGVRSAEILLDLESAKNAFQTDRDLEPNRIWIRKLLDWYYDPIYSRWAVVTPRPIKS